MSIFTEHLKQEHQWIRSVIALLESYHKDLADQIAVSAEELRMISFALHILVEKSHLAKEEHLLYPALEPFVSEQGSALHDTWNQLMEANEHSKLSLLRLRMSIDTFAANPSVAEVLNFRLGEYIQQMRAHIDKEEYLIFSKVDELLSHENQKDLLARAHEMEANQGKDHLEAPRRILNELCIARGIQVH